MWDSIVLSAALYYAKSDEHSNMLSKISRARRDITISMLILLLFYTFFFIPSICKKESLLISLWITILPFIDIGYFWFMSIYRIETNYFEYVLGQLLVLSINIFVCIIALIPSNENRCEEGILTIKVYMLIAYILLPFITSLLIIDISNRRFNNNNNRIVTENRQSSPNQEECAICLSPLEGEISKISCSHFFHTECINTWIQQSEKCPLCRSNV